MPRKHRFSECMGAMLANPYHPYIQRGDSPFVIYVVQGGTLLFGMGHSRAKRVPKRGTSPTGGRDFFF